MWCIPKLDDEYIARMEDVLDTLAAPADSKAPIVAIDERPVQLLDDVRRTKPAQCGRLARRDYEYKRCGTANIFCIVAPHEGRHLTYATPTRKGVDFARALERIAKAYVAADIIHLICDNLSTHAVSSLINAFGEQKGRALWDRFRVHYTPKHASWLNPAEIEVSLVSRECLGHVRVASLADLRHRVRSWNRRADRQRRIIRWRFTSDDAQRVFRYARSSNASRSEH
jgi:transposase